MTIQVGQIVKFAQPTSKGEESERYVVLEVNGDRSLVQFICDWPLKPTSVYLTADLITAE